MPCPEFEDLLAGYDDLPGERRRAVDSHLALCSDCKAYQIALEEVDSALTAAFAGSQVPAAFQHAVLARLPQRAPVKRPSLLPEVLDLTGGAAVLAIALLLIYAAASTSEVDIPAYWIVGVLFFITGLFVACRSFADLKR